MWSRLLTTDWTQFWLKLPSLYYKALTDPEFLSESEEDRKLRQRIMRALPSAGVSQMYYFARERAQRYGAPVVVYPEPDARIVAAAAVATEFGLVSGVLLASNDQLESLRPALVTLLEHPSVRSYIEQLRFGFVTPSLSAEGSVRRWLDRKGVRVIDPATALQNGMSDCVDLLHERFMERRKAHSCAAVMPSERRKEQKEPLRVIMDNWTYMGALMTEFPKGHPAHADLCISGAATTTPDVLRALIHSCVKPGERLGGYAPVFLSLPTKGGSNIFTIADPAVLEVPTVQERAMLGLLATRVNQRLGIVQPRCGFVSSSTNGSGDNEHTPLFILEQRQAAQIAAPLITAAGGICDPHESQFDALTVPGVKKTSVDGRGDCGVFEKLPDANEALKLLENLGVSAGPIVARMPTHGVGGTVEDVNVSDMSRSADFQSVLTTTGYRSRHWEARTI